MHCYQVPLVVLEQQAQLVQPERKGQLVVWVRPEAQDLRDQSVPLEHLERQGQQEMTVQRVLSAAQEHRVQWVPLGRQENPEYQEILSRGKLATPGQPDPWDRLVALATQVQLVPLEQQVLLETWVQLAALAQLVRWAQLAVLVQLVHRVQLEAQVSILNKRIT